MLNYTFDYRPGVYTNVFAAMDWITLVINNFEPSQLTPGPFGPTNQEFIKKGIKIPYHWK